MQNYPVCMASSISHTLGFILENFVLICNHLISVVDRGSFFRFPRVPQENVYTNVITPTRPEPSDQRSTALA